MESQVKPFKFFIPIDIIEKGKNKEGKEVMKICGVASTPQLDTDGQYLNPKGFDLSFFKSNGFINWNHLAKKDPAYYIGEPTEGTRITDNNELWIEAELWAESELAKSVWGLANTLKKRKSNRKLSYSVEGKILDSNKDNSNVKKALITSVAITPAPKCPGTWLDIMKGNLYEEDEYEYELKKGNPNGGEVYIIDITDEKGDRIIVDKEINIKIQKALSTTSGGILKKEDVEGNLKNLTGPNMDIQIKDGKLEMIKSMLILTKAYELGILKGEIWGEIKQKIKQIK